MAEFGRQEPEIYSSNGFKKVVATAEDRASEHDLDFRIFCEWNYKLSPTGRSMRQLP